MRDFLFRPMRRRGAIAVLVAAIAPWCVAAEPAPATLDDAGADAAAPAQAASMLDGASLRADDASALDLAGLRRVARDTGPSTDVTVQLKPEPSSQLKIRVYGSAPLQSGQNVFDAPQRGPTAGTSADAVVTQAASAWWAVQTRLSSQRLPGHTLLFGNDWRVSPTGSGRGADVGAPAADRGRSSFVEDRSLPLPDVSLSTGLRQTATDAVASDTQPWVAVETKPRDDLALRYVHGDAYRPLPAVGDASAAVRPDNAHDTRAVGHSVAIEQQVSANSRWTLAAFDNPAHTPGAVAPSAADRLIMQGSGAVPRNRGVRLAAVHSASDGTRLSVDYLTQTVVIPATDPLPNGAPAPDDHRAAHVGRVAAALPIDGHWKLGAETVMVGRYGATAGYGLTHLALVSNALDDRTTVSVQLYDVLDRRPADTSVGSALQPASAAAIATQPPEGRGVRLAVGLPF